LVSSPSFFSGCSTLFVTSASIASAPLGIWFRGRTLIG
jgi:hypothetical protein